MQSFHCESCQNPIEVAKDLCAELTRCALCGTTQVVPDPVLAAGSRLECYRVNKYLGTNPIWASYTASRMPEGSENEVILKTPTSFLLKHIDSTVAFGEMTARHGTVGIPGFQRLIDWSIEEGAAFFTFEGYGGSNALNELKGSLMPFDSDVALDVVLRLATALGDLWEQKHLTHQNLKPKNIRLAKDTLAINIMNLGLSTFVLGQPRLLREGVNMWDIRYLSPEFAMDGRGDTPLCDIYSIGSVLYLMLTGLHPREGLDMNGIVAAGPLNPLAVTPAVDPRVAELVRAMTHTDPARRIDSWPEVLRRLSGLLAPDTLRDTKSMLVINRFKKASVTDNYKRIRLIPAEANDVAIELTPDKALKITTLAPKVTESAVAEAVIPDKDDGNKNGNKRKSKIEAKSKIEDASALEGKEASVLIPVGTSAMPEEMGKASWRALLLAATAGAFATLFVCVLTFACLPNNARGKAGRSRTSPSAVSGNESAPGAIQYKPLPADTTPELEPLLAEFNTWAKTAAERLGRIHTKAHARRQGGYVVLYVQASSEFAAKSLENKLKTLDELDRFWAAWVAAESAPSSPTQPRVVFYSATGQILCGSTEQTASRLFIER